MSGISNSGIKDSFSFLKKYFNDAQYRDDFCSKKPYFTMEIFKDFIEKSVIYFLLNKENEILYIGKTNCLLQRIMEHFSGEGRKNRIKYKKDFHSFSFWFVDENNLDFMESFLIAFYQPIYNEKIGRIENVYSNKAKYLGMSNTEFYNTYLKNNKTFYKKLLLYWLNTCNNKDELSFKNPEELLQISKESYAQLRQTKYR